MRITELLKKESIELGVKVADKNAAIDKLISLMDAGGRLNSTQGYKEGIFYGFLLFLRFFSIELIKIRTMNMIDNRNFSKRGTWKYSHW